MENEENSEFRKKPHIEGFTAEQLAWMSDVDLDLRDDDPNLRAHRGLMDGETLRRNDIAQAYLDSNPLPEKTNNRVPYSRLEKWLLRGAIGGFILSFEIDHLDPSAETATLSVGMLSAFALGGFFYKRWGFSGYGRHDR